jgi:asparagine synthase (glutamine-hydrolysing)
MLMAHSVEGRFPFLDRHVAALADSLPASYKLRVLDEKHVLKRAAEPLVAPEIISRRKQPYRAPDALSFTEPAAREWIESVADGSALRDAGVFQPVAARALIEKCTKKTEAGQFSNADNMALVGVLSAQLVYHHFIAGSPAVAVPSVIRTIVDRASAPAAVV